MEKKNNDDFTCVIHYVAFDSPSSSCVALFISLPFLIEFMFRSNPRAMECYKHDSNAM